ncbi:carbohydrate-binding family 9-like protein [Porphyromonas sp. COT-290 OH860]|uniref:carbohydrate-binding family 9-like protein n=1 Tax=Porphyromonas sp. COT-290 OH860 TaxID=1515615 RepID=UPI00052B85E8|nr:carbohydrate-binding family 9-like protein [Porphyromonas sp. COT-290 OH860]KGN86109.1 hypothetical protein HQ41_02150 [Porphyromonas sp. COT-290 OH860]
MKRTTIPFVDLSSTSMTDLPLLLESRGRRLHIDTLPWEADFPYQPIAVVDIAHCHEGIALHYFVRGLDLRTLSEGDGHYVHEDSCVEFFMQREEGEAYINFEFNAAGVCYASHHPRVGEGTGFTAEEFATIRRHATYADQKLDQTGLHTWELTALIPWTTMGYAEGERPQSMRANFYKCADGTAHPHYLSWSPIVEEQPAFHRPQFFGELIFEQA